MTVNNLTLYFGHLGLRKWTGDSKGKMSQKNNKLKVPHNPDNQSLIPGPHKKPQVVARVCNSSTPTAKWERQENHQEVQKFITQLA